MISKNQAMQRCKKRSTRHSASEARTQLSTEAWPAGCKDIYYRIGETPGKNQNKSSTCTGMWQRILRKESLIPTSPCWDGWRLKHIFESVVESGHSGRLVREPATVLVHTTAGGRPPGESSPTDKPPGNQPARHAGSWHLLLNLWRLMIGALGVGDQQSWALTSRRPSEVPSTLESPIGLSGPQEAVAVDQITRSPWQCPHGTNRNRQPGPLRSHMEKNE